MPRSRLRFLLQEVDLPLGVTTIGRSLDCHVTLDDPLVSRRHARIIVGADRALIEDAGSRNGVTVNGASLRGKAELFDGDRVRIGTQELVYCKQGATEGGAPRRATGQLRLCASCHTPYPREAVFCPTCEAVEQAEEDTVTGNGTLGEKGTSSVALLVEALERALLLGRVNDAQRIVRRASEQIEQLVTTGGAVDAELLAALAGQAVELTAASHDPTWALWVLDVYTRTRQIPPIDVVERLVEVGRAAARRPTAAPGTIGHLFDRLGVGARALVQSEESDVPNEPGLGG